MQVQGSPTRPYGELQSQKALPSCEVLGQNGGVLPPQPDSCQMQLPLEGCGPGVASQLRPPEGVGVEVPQESCELRTQPISEDTEGEAWLVVMATKHPTSRVSPALGGPVLFTPR